MNVDITVLVTLVGVVGTVSGIYFGFWKAKKDEQKTLKEDTVQDTVVATKLDYISKGVDDIRLDIKAQDKRISDVVERLIKVEESTKSAHHRIDSLEEK
ncbi:hypothetical protein EHZ13_14950 [Clostridium perfringens]|uniref:hypothetical protein n=1 Tax=Clostridium perfringens TaxID=1502 RepID=UPI000F51C933|nr:hypothetical protein [Clostridium perfringens]MDK3122666.1 hypothetical protein [Clostridium perfringens]RQN11218.1 hypothetical protein EHZ13_14950 [Clostridium perfringens]